MSSKKFSKAATMEKNAYMREWRKKNKDKVQAANRRYWERRAKRKEEADHADGE